MPHRRASALQSPGAAARASPKSPRASAPEKTATRKIPASNPNPAADKSGSRKETPASQPEKSPSAPPAAAGTPAQPHSTSNRTTDIGPRFAGNRNQGIGSNSYHLKRHGNRRGRMHTFSHLPAARTLSRSRKNSIRRA